MKPDCTLVDAIRDAETPKELCNALHSLASAIGTGKVHYSSIRSDVSRTADSFPEATISLDLILPLAPQEKQS